MFKAALNVIFQVWVRLLEEEPGLLWGHYWHPLQQHQLLLPRVLVWVELISALPLRIRVTPHLEQMHCMSYLTNCVK